MAESGVRAGLAEGAEREARNDGARRECRPREEDHSRSADSGVGKGYSGGYPRTIIAASDRTSSECSGADGRAPDKKRRGSPRRNQPREGSARAGESRQGHCPTSPPGGGRGADDRVSEQVEKTEPAETTRPTNIEDGGAQPEAARVDQASDEARNSEAAHLGTGPEQTAQPEATRTQESDEDPPSSRRQLIHEIQMYLTARGYEPGPIDGLYGRRTKGAIEAFERDMGITPTGEATIGLWRKVQRGVKPGTGPQPRGESTEATRKTGQTSRGNAGGKQGASDPTDPARRSERTTWDRNSEQDSGVVDASHFTMGSHSGDVLRIQGKPDAITRYDASGTMTWR